MPQLSDSLLLRNTLVSVLGYGFVTLGNLALAAAAEPRPAKVDYATKIAPLLAEHCVRCHGPKLQESELRLDTLDNIQLGGKKGPAAVPGNSAESPLIRAIRGERPYREMPPDAPSLRPADIKLLADWIDGLLVDSQPRSSPGVPK